METAVIRVPSDDPHVDASFEPVFQHTNKKFVCTKYIVPHHQKKHFYWITSTFLYNFL